MNVIVIQVFVSLMLVVGSIVMFLFSARQRDFEHADRLALAPLDSDSGCANEDLAAPKGDRTSDPPEEKECTPRKSNTTIP